MLGNYLQKLKSLNKVSQFYFSKKTIVDLKKFRLQNEPQNGQEQSKISFSQNQQIDSKGQKESNQNKSMFKQKSSQNVKVNEHYIKKQSPQETKSRQLSAEILICSTEKDLYNIFYKSSIPLESQHFAMIFYKLFKLRQIQQIYAIHKKRLQNSSEEISTQIKERDAIWTNKSFLEIYDKIILNLENMNPDSLNLLIKALGKRRAVGGNHKLSYQLFNAIIDLLAKDNNIQLYNEFQLFYLISNLAKLKNYYKENQASQNIIQQALSKLAPSLMQFKRIQLLRLTIVSLLLGLYENNFHVKLNQAVLRRHKYLKSTDYTLLFQYNVLYYSQNSQKKLTKDREQEKMEIFNRIFYYIEKNHVFKTTNFKSLMKFCAYIYNMNLKLDKERILIEELQNNISNRFSEYIDDAIQNKEKCTTHPIFLNDAFKFILSHPEIYTDNKQFFIYLRKYVNQVESVEYDNYLHVSHFVIECINNHENGSQIQKIKDFQFEANNLLISTLNQVLTKINANFSDIGYYSLEEVFELIQKIHQIPTLKEHLHQLDVDRIFLKSIKYTSQINYKMSTPVVIKIAKIMKNLFHTYGTYKNKCLTYLKRYAFNEYLTKYEDAIKITEFKEYFKSLGQEIDIDSLAKSDKPEKSINDFDFSEDLENVQEQIYKQAQQQQEELIKRKSQQEEEKQKFPLLYVPSIQVLKKQNDKYEQYMKCIEILRRQTHCVNSILMSQIILSDENLKLEENNIWQESTKSFNNYVIPQLLTIDNINNIIIIKQIYKINNMDYLKETQLINQLCDQRIQKLTQHFETRKKPKREIMIQKIEKLYSKQISKIEECVLEENAFIDVVITLLNGDSIAIIEASKMLDLSDKGKGFDSQEDKISNLTQLRKQIIQQFGYKQIIVVDNHNFKDQIQI